MKYKKTGFIGRFKPLHNGGALVLDEMCARSEHVVIGLGSANRYDLRNPFTWEESRDMVDAFLSENHDNYSFVVIPDFAHIPEYSDGQRWKQEVIKEFGELDLFLAGNDYVRGLLEDTYTIMNSHEFIPREKHIFLNATEVRVRMASNKNWQELVPEKVADYIERAGLHERFRKEFGPRTLNDVVNNYRRKLTAAEEKLNAQGVPIW